MIDDMAKMFSHYIDAGHQNDPAIFHYHRLISQGLEAEDAIKKVSCVSAMLTLGKMSGNELSNDFISKMYGSLPESDAEEYLYGLCK